MSDCYKKSAIMLKSCDGTGQHNAGYRREAPITAAIATKLVRDTRNGTNNRHYGNTLQARADALFSQSERITTNINDVENIFEILPETARCEMIITSCILAPDDMKTVSLRYVCDRTGIPATIQSSMLAVLEDFGTKTYKIKEKLPKILSASLFRTGSYPVLCVPESSLDLLINHDNRISVESRSTLDNELSPLGVLGDNDATLRALGKEHGDGTLNYGLESLLSNDGPPAMTSNVILPGITVTDNPNVIKLPKLQEAMSQQRIMDIYGTRRNVGMESNTESQQLNEMARRLFKRRRSRVEDVVRIRTQDQTNRNSIGHPMLMDLPSDSVIPVANPSKMSEHFGYFILLDTYGNPVSNSSDSPYAEELSTRLKRNQTEAASMLSQMKTSLYGNCPNDNSDYKKMMYADVMEYIDRDLLERFNNGAMCGRSVHIARTNATNQIMWSRILANKETQLVYVPAELMSYFAFDYNRVGIGKSLTDGTKILASLRAIMLFASTRASVRGAVGHKTLNLKLDPAISDPEKWVQQMVHEYVRVNNGNYPLATSNPNDIMSYLNQAGVSVNVSNHPGYPEVESSIETTPSAITQIDPEIDRDLARRQIAHYGLPPEVVDASTGVDFAATIRTSNVFLDKQMTQYAHRLCDMVSDHLRMIAANSGTIMADLFSAIDSNAELITDDIKRNPEWRTDLVLKFLENFRVELPESNNTRLETQMQKLSVYSQMLDAVFAAFANVEVLQQLDPESDREQCEATSTIMRQHFLREFIVSEGILPEVTDALTWPGDEQDPALDFMAAQTGYIDALRNTLGNLMTSIKERHVKERERAGETVEEQTTGGGGNSDFEPLIDLPTETTTTETEPETNEVPYQDEFGTPPNGTSPNEAV